MEKITIVVIFLGALIFFSHLFNKLFDKTKIPNVLLLMLIGIVGGSFIDKVMFFGEIGQVFTTITLVIILFESGTNLKFSDLKKALGSAVTLTIYNFLITTALITFLLLTITKFDTVSAFFVAAIIGGTSSAVVIPMIKQLKLGEKSNTILLLESAFSDVLCLVVGLAALEGMKAGAIEFSSILHMMWKSFLFALLLGLAGGIIWSFLLNWIRAIKNSMFTTIAFLFIVYGGVELLGYNGGIASLAFGIILGNAESLTKTKLWKRIFSFEAGSLSNNEKDFFSEIVFVFQTYFFVYVGVVLEFGNHTTYLIASLLVLVILLMRPLGVFLVSRKGCNPREKTIMSVMSPKGLVPAILASIPLQLNLNFGKEIAELGYAVVLLSIVVCSVLIMIVSKDPLFFNKMVRKNKENKQNTDTAKNTLKESEEQEQDENFEDDD